jgi:hypothetical protein
MLLGKADNKMNRQVKILNIIFILKSSFFGMDLN